MDNGVRILKDSYEKIPIDENFKLIAGPGAGKTTFLVNHIKNVVRDSDKLKNGRKILCITYTNVAVNTIKERLGEYNNDVEISTIHHFLFKHILKPYIWVLKDDISPNLMDLSKVNISFPSFSALPENRTKKLLAMNYQIDEIFSQLKKFYWDLDESDNIEPICNGEIYFDDEFLWLFKENQWNSQKISFSDILKFAYEIIIKEPKIVEILRIKFPYIFIDEFQDVCNIQKRIVELVCKSNVVCGIIGDPAQSIYSFRGAVYGNMDEINLDLNEYKILINRRSNKKIVNVLNNLRNDDLVQDFINTEINNSPTLLIGDELDAYNYIDNHIGGEINVLAYKHKFLNDLEYKISVGGEDNRNCLNEFWELDDNPRKLIIVYIINAIEFFREGDIKEALRHMVFGCHYFESDKKILVKKLFEISQNYSKFKNGSILDFYLEYIYIEEVKELAGFRSGKRKDIYNQIQYSDLVRDIKNRHNSLFRTIHDCKGDEFDNVLVLTGDENLNFLYNFDIKTSIHRVFYVALSRAKNNLFVSIPELDQALNSKIQEKGFNIIVLNELDMLTHNK